MSILGKRSQTVDPSYWARENNRKNYQKYRFCKFDQNGTFRLNSLQWTRLWESKTLFLLWNQRMKMQQAYCVGMVIHRVQLLSPSFFRLDQSQDEQWGNECYIGLRPAIHFSYFAFQGYFVNVIVKHTTKYETLTIHFSYFMRILCFTNAAKK